METAVGEQGILDALKHVPTERWGQVLDDLAALRDEATEIRTAADLSRSELVGLWADRTDIPDSQEFARQLRRKEFGEEFGVSS